MHRHLSRKCARGERHIKVIVCHGLRGHNRLVVEPADAPRSGRERGPADELSAGATGLVNLLEAKLETSLRGRLLSCLDKRGWSVDGLCDIALVPGLPELTGFQCTALEKT